MKSSGLVLIAIMLAGVVFAQETRRVINPVAIYGKWFGMTAGMPPDCTGDGFVVDLNTEDGNLFFMSVQSRTAGVLSTPPVVTEYRIMLPPETAPLRLDIFLKSKNGNIGIRIPTGSTLEFSPAGADNSFPQTSLYLRRCS